MSEAESPSTRYVEYAFKDQHNLVVLFGAACFSLAFASPLPILVSAGGELLWLVLGPRLPAFRTWVDRQLGIQYLARAEAAIEGALCELSEGDANRYRALSQSATQLERSAEPRLSQRELQQVVHALLELRRTFLDYLFLGQRVEALVDATPGAELEKQVAQLQQAYDAEKDLAVRMTIRKGRTSLQRSIDQQSALGDVRRAIQLRLEMLEKSLPYLESRLADPAFQLLAPEIDIALVEIGLAEPLELAVDAIFDQPTAFVSQ